METPTIQDYEDAIRVGDRLIKSSKLNGGYAKELPRGGYVKFSGGFCVVFPFMKPNGNKCALRCWTASVSDSKARSQAIAKKLEELNLPYFVSFEYEENGIVAKGEVQPVVIMDWVDACTMKEYIEKHLNDATLIRKLADSFKKMCRCLHENGISHGDLQHGNIMVKESGDIVLVDYDSMYVPELEGYSDEIHGLHGYQHPARFKNDILTPKADYFSELVIYTSIVSLAEHMDWWDKFQIKESDTFLFSAEDIKNPSSSEVLSLLKSDGNNELRELGLSVEQALHESSLNMLKPLEAVTVPSIDSFAQDIDNFLNNRPKQKRTLFEVHDNPAFSSSLDSFLKGKGK